MLNTSIIIPLKETKKDGMYIQYNKGKNVKNELLLRVGNIIIRKEIKR